MAGEQALSLSAGQLGVAAALLLLAGAVSLLLSIGLEKRLALAATRTVVQLLLVGYVLKWVFDLSTGPVIGLVVGVMIAVASRTAVSRPSRTFRGAGIRAFGTLAISALTVTWIVTAAVIRVDPWYEPRYMIPLLGMILGNSMTGISLCLDHLLETLAERKAEVEMELALGATRWEAARRPLADAVRRGMIPIINTMMVVGIVSLPGMMTGQILAGADPMRAVKYQIVVMFMICAAVAIGCILLALLVYACLFNEKHQLSVQQIRRQSG